MVITFYSFKGGVGRSMALANVAEVLADLGYSVILCDWDLEAPGLEHYLCDDTSSIAEWRRHPGVIDLVQEYKETIARPNTAHQDSPDFATVEKLRLRRPSSYAVPVSRPARQSNGSIRFLSAGRRDGPWEAQYGASVRDSDWGDFYSKWAGGAYFEFFREDLEKSARIVLIDSRTGVTELGGVCTHHLPDLVLLLSAANEQNLKGTEWMASVLSDERLIEQRKSRPLSVIPVASRIDSLSEINMTTGFLREFKETFSRFVPEPLGQAQEFLQESMIPYAGAFSFKETNVARLPAEQRHPVLYKPYQVLADAIIRWGKSSGLLHAHEPGPSPLAGAESLRTPGAVATGVAPLLPQGEFFLAWVGSDRDRAAELAEALQSAGLEVWCDLLQEKVRGSEPIARQARSAIARSVGCLILLPREPLGSWLEVEINLALNRQASREGYRVLLLAPESAPALPTALKRFPIFPLPNEGTASAIPRILAELLPSQKLAPEPSAGAIMDALKSPSERESRFLFGRGAEVDELIDMIEEALAARRWFLVLSGAPGCGKATLIRAGLIPAFQRGLVGDRRTSWRIAVVEPGGEADAKIRGPIVHALGLAPDTCHDWPALLAALEKVSEALLIILINADGMLEGVTPAATFPLAQLAELQRACHAGFFAVFSVRDSSLLAFQKVASPAFASYPLHRVPPPDAVGIRQFFDGVARLLGVTYEAGLPGVLVADAIRLNAPARSLGAVLQRLWEARNSTEQLTHEAYRSFGGIEGWIVEDAGRGLEKIDRQTNGALRRIVLALIDGRTGVLLQRPREELLRSIRIKSARLSVFEIFLNPARLIGGTPEDEPESREALTVLSNKGIVLAGGDGRLRLASRAIAGIPTFQQWLAEDATHRLRAELEDGAQHWLDAARLDDLLPRGSVLRDLTRVRSTTEAGREYLAAGIAAWRRRGLIQGIIFLALAIFIAFSIRAELVANLRLRLDDAGVRQEKLLLNETKERLEASLAASSKKVADLEANLGKLSSSTDATMAAQTKASSAAAELKGRLDSCETLDKQGDQARDGGKLDDAVKFYQSSLILREKLANENKDDPERQFDLSGSFSNVGNMLLVLGKITEARAEFEKALALRRALATHAPSDPRWQRSVMFSLIELYDAQRKLNNLDAARGFAIEAQGIATGLVNKEPKNPIWKKDLQTANDIIDSLAALAKPKR